MDRTKRYIAGLDFGTLSCRCILVSAEDGSVIAEETCGYPNGVMEKQLPGGTPLPAGFALQHPGDYLKALETAIHGALEKAGIAPDRIGGIGLDFTSCTILPVTAELTPLCFLPEFAQQPHAYVKLWKHHGAAPEAEEITELAVRRSESWLELCGGRMNAEYGLPKILETLRRAPEVYRSAARFMEAGDWIASLLTGREIRSANFAGAKLQWDEQNGYFSEAFLKELDPGLQDLVEEKLSGPVLPVSKAAGTLSKAGAKLTGLLEGTPVAVPVVDAYAGMPGCRAAEPGELMMVLGTSACHLVHGTEQKKIPGVFGRVKDGVIPGYYTYEAGQSAVGDLLAWFTETSVPAAYQEEARARQMGIHELLSERAAALKPGSGGLLALDWVGGCRTPYNDAALTGIMTGLKLSTTPEEQYRAWIESLAFGTERILETFEENGVAVRRILVSGGIAKKNPLLLRIYADVTGRDMEVVASAQAAALGSAIYGAAAAGFYSDVKAASLAMGSPVKTVYRPDPQNHMIYQELYRRYHDLSEQFAGERRKRGNDFE